MKKYRGRFRNDISVDVNVELSDYIEDIKTELTKEDILDLCEEFKIEVVKKEDDDEPKKEKHRLYKGEITVSVDIDLFDYVDDIKELLEEDEVIELMEEHKLNKEIIYKNLNKMERKDYLCDIFGVSYFTTKEDIIKLLNDSF